MATYKAPLREIRFILDDVLKVGELSQLPELGEADVDVIQGVIGEAAKLIEEQLAPLHMPSDAGCRLADGQVQVPSGYAGFYREYQQAGWIGIAHKSEFGGAGLPFLVGKVIEEMVCSANVSFALYPGLTTGCFEALEANADEQQKALYCHKLATGEWAGTMCITEPQAGSDVGAIRTRATVQADGSYLLEGNKIFISSGEHGMTDNIIHFVLARMHDSPPGVKGLSTFVVPKFLLKPDGSIGERNAVRCVSIEHKMGLHGSCTCALSFEQARGWLVGRPNEGIQNMFVMMNLARIMVAFQGLGQSELATQNAIRYAQERKQGRATGGSEFIVDHPDVRRMLLHMKALNEGGRLLAYETAKFVDLARHHPQAEVREEAQDWVDLNTPLTKAFCTDTGVELGSMAVQVYGGHGYIREHGIEQIVRDAKILCIYEGTNGVQSMDLVRRKLMMHGGRLPRRFFARIRVQVEAAGAAFSFIGHPLSAALDAVESTTAAIQTSHQRAADDAAFGCADFLRAFALTYLGYNWLRMAQAAQGTDDPAFAAAKRATAEYFATRLLTQVPVLCANATQPASNLMDLPAQSL